MLQRDNYGMYARDATVAFSKAWLQVILRVSAGCTYLGYDDIFWEKTRERVSMGLAWQVAGRVKDQIVHNRDICRHSSLQGKPYYFKPQQAPCMQDVLDALHASGTVPCFEVKQNLEGDETLQHDPPPTSKDQSLLLLACSPASVSHSPLQQCGLPPWR